MSNIRELRKNHGVPRKSITNPNYRPSYGDENIRNCLSLPPPPPPHVRVWGETFRSLLSQGEKLTQALQAAV